MKSSKVRHVQKATRAKTLRLEAEVAHDMEIIVTMRRLRGTKPNTLNAIANEALRKWIDRRPISKMERAAFERLVLAKGGAS